jgi:heterodisulfide reductase subunit C2
MRQAETLAHEDRFAVDVLELEPVQEMIRACIQCGTCTGSCPNAFAMDCTPRQLWRLVMLGQVEAVFESRTFMLCSACYTCTLRCPRGLLLTEAMHALKQIAARKHFKRYRSSTAFYRNFIESVRRHGRVNEFEFMAFYFAEMKNPLLPLRYTPLGLRLLAKGKVSPKLPLRRSRLLETIFRKVATMEDSS